MTDRASQQSGFTLPELMVSLVLFLLLVGSVASLLISAIAVQRKSLATQELVSQTSYFSEYMSRMVRQARKETNQGCLSQTGKNYEITHGGQGLKFNNSQNQCQEFYLNGGRITEVRGLQTQYLTPTGSTVATLNFSITGETDADNLQPKVSLFMNIQTTGTRPEAVVSLPVQTTLSQRNFDVQ